MIGLSKCVPVTALAVVLAAYGLECLGMGTPEQAMQCCNRMRCRSHHKTRYHGSQDCCNTMGQIRPSLGQPSSIHGITLVVATLRVAQASSDSQIVKCPDRIVAMHSHDPPSSFPTPAVCLRI